MDPAFLELPDEVIRLTLKSHQKTFTVRGADGKLAPNFVIMANLETPDDGATIKAGNAKVISARLSDAKFFQEQDRQKKLIDYYDQLDEVVFHKKLGSVRDKADRVAALAREIAPHVGADPDLAEQAAKLAKCDLVTQTVIEATSLQGQVGRWMYEAEQLSSRPSLKGAEPGPNAEKHAGLDEQTTGPGSPRGVRDDRFSETDHADIAVAIEDHYKPQGPSDAVPTNKVAVAVALADKIDTLVSFWAIDEKPTGSKDPFALRRAALGVVRILIENSISPRLSIQLVKAAIPIEVRENYALLENAKRAFGEAFSQLLEEDASIEDIKKLFDKIEMYFK
jgi:glycyl-tRNA synthetase beta chain